MLSLWRERWGKAGVSALKVPYLKGSLNRWSDQLIAAGVWSLLGVSVMTVLLCVLSLALVVSTELSLNSQIVFSAVIFGISLYARRYGGAWVTLVLVGLSLIASARYLFWRFDATLGPHLDLALLLGFGLCAAELHLWLLKIFDLLVGAFPLKRASVPLPTDSEDWPTVDVFIPCQGQSAVSIEQAAKAALALDWPKEKIKCYFLDDSPTDTTRRLASSMGFSYLSTPQNDAGKIGSINQALPVTQGEWIVVFDGNCTPDKKFLISVAGWWVADTKLGMMQTARHFLVPSPSKRSLAILQTPELGGSCAMIRRSMLSQVGGLIPAPVTAKAHIALKLQAMGFGNAYVGFAVPPSQDPDQGKHAPGIGQPALPALQVFRVDQPFLGRALGFKHCLGDLQAMLAFYRLVPLLIFFTAPVAYLLADIRLIQTSPELLAAYALPHWLQSHIAQARSEGKTRLTVLADLLEMALGLYLLLATSLSVVRAEYRQWFNPRKREEARSQEAFDSLIAWPYAVVLLLNLAGFTSGVYQLVLPANKGHEMATLYLAWASYNLLLLAAMLAVAEESRHIRRQARLQSRLAATVRLPSGRAMSCMTENFPQTALIIELPVPMALKMGVKVDISIFRHHCEVVFPAQVAFSQGNVLCVDIEETAQTHYRTFGAAVFSRGPDWPKWLPERDADWPFPAWVNHAFGAAHAAVSRVKKRLSKFFQWARLGS